MEELLGVRRDERSDEQPSMWLFADMARRSLAVALCELSLESAFVKLRRDSLRASQ